MLNKWRLDPGGGGNVRRVEGPTRTRLAIAVLALALLGVSAVAVAVVYRESIVFTFAGQKQPGASAPLRLDIEYVNPDDPSAKPPAVQTVVEKLAAGTKIDTSVPDRCTASDPELIAQGASACPPGSIVGGGKVNLDSGIPGPARIFHFNVTELNAENELILLFESTDVPGQRTPSHAAIKGATITAESPPIPGGPPDGFTAIKSVHLTVNAVTKGGKNYVTTPSTCPASGSWTNSITFTYRDGKTETRTSNSPCTKDGGGGGGDHKKPKVSIHGVPKGCVTRSFTAHVETTDRSALSSQTVKLDGNVLKRTKRKSFDVTVPVHGLGAGSHRISVAATDSAGNRGTRSASFRRCGADDDDDD